MDKIVFPQTLIFDIYDIVSEFMSIYIPGGGPLSDYDHVFVEEVLTVLSPAFTDFNNFNDVLHSRMEYFADNTIHYGDRVGDQRLLMEAASIMAQAIVMKLRLSGVFVSGFFPYNFKQLTRSRSIVFELGPEYVGDRYCDPRV